MTGIEYTAASRFRQKNPGCFSLFSQASTS